jgi:Fe(3+) dicitrate transport protein
MSSYNAIGGKINSFLIMPTTNFVVPDGWRENRIVKYVTHMYFLEYAFTENQTSSRIHQYGLPNANKQVV